MNTNSNTYTVIYTTIVVVLVAAVLAFVSQKLGPMQAANEKAETNSQILTAAQFGSKEEWQKKGNVATLDFYKENIGSVIIVDCQGNTVDSLDCSKAEVYSTAELKAQNYLVKDEAKISGAKIPVYRFKNGTSVIPIYGAGLWGPVWGYIALDEDLQTISGAYFDHESETPGLGGKIKDDPSFREQFKGKKIDYSDAAPFNIVKGGTPADKCNAIDAVTGATMTSNGLHKAINTWLAAYKNALENNKAADPAAVAEADSLATAPADSLIIMEEQGNE